MSVCVNVAVCRYTQRPEEGVGSLLLELQVIVSHLTWVLGIELADLSKNSRFSLVPTAPLIEKTGFTMSLPLPSHVILFMIFLSPLDGDVYSTHHVQASVKGT